MELYLLAYIGISLLVVLLIVLRLKKRIPAKENPYLKVNRLFSPTERSFYAVLCQACDQRAIVFGKTNLQGILNAQQRLVKQQKQQRRANSQQRIECQKGLSRIADNDFDYVICDSRTLKILAVVELEVSAKKCAKRNRSLQGACHSAKLALHHFKAEQKYTVDEVEKALFSPTDGSFKPRSVKILESLE